MSSPVQPLVELGGGRKTQEQKVSAAAHSHKDERKLVAQNLQFVPPGILL